MHSWLREQGVYRQLADAYERSAWIVSVGRGAFVRADDKVEWPGAIYAVQKQLGQAVHIGGKTALELRGSGHFLAMKRQTVWVLGATAPKLPAWLRGHDWGVRLRTAGVALFKPDKGVGLEGMDFGMFQVQISSRERAILEVLHFVPQKQSFEEAQMLMEGLTTLRVELVAELLQRCRSVKVNRLFLYMAEAAGHSWFKKLDLSNIRLGSGKRVVVKGGMLDTKYQITVPRAKEQEEG